MPRHNKGLRSENAQRQLPFSRRKMLAATGTSIAWFAGCLADDNDDQDPSDNGDPGDNGDDNGETDDNGEAGFVEDAELRWWTTAIEDLTNGELNWSNPGVSHEFFGWFYFLGWNDSPTHGELYLEGFEDIVFDPDEDTYTFVLRDGIKWHQGTEIIDDFTVEDMVLQWEMDTHPELGGQNPDPINELEVVDDRTLVAHLTDGYHTQQLELTPPLDRTIGCYTYRNGELAALFEELRELDEDGSEDQVNEVVEKIITHQMPTDGSVPLSGPWMIENAHRQRLQLKRVPGHPLTDDPEFGNNWDTAVLEVTGGGGQAIYEAAVNDQVDFGGTTFPSDLGRDDIPDHLSIPVSRGIQSRSIQVNYAGRINDFLQVPEGEAAPLSVAKVRQALAYAIDMENMYRNNEEGMMADIVAYPERAYVGDGNLIQRQYPDLWDQLPDYGVNAQPEMAEQRLEEAGLARDGESWVTPNGDPFELEFPVWDFDDGKATTFASNLGDIGVPVEVSMEEPGAHVEQIRRGVVPVTTGAAVSAITPPDVQCNSMLSSTGNTWAWAQHNPPGLYEIPEIGDMEGEAVETFNADEVVDLINSGGMEEDVEIKKKVIWTFAYHLPKIPTYPQMESVVLNNNHFEWPGDDERLFQVTQDHPVYMGTSWPEWFSYRRGVPGQRAKDT